MFEIINNTPKWVFFVFLALLVVGFIQAKQRELTDKAVLILPVAMIFFSLFGVYSVFAIKIAAILMWAIGLIVATLIGIYLGFPKSVIYLPQTKKFVVPGSWAPLFFMMAIFFTRYFVGYSIAGELIFIDSFIFLALVSFAYGAFSGVFVSRSFIVLKAKRNHD